jgi:four helix bundle protein
MTSKRPVRIQSFKDLEIWKRGIDLTEAVYEITKSFPKEETYGLVSQMRRAAVSIPSNIAEGFGRFHNKEYKQYLHISLGSCAELITQFVITERLKYINKNTSNKLSTEADEISKMVMSLIKKL